MNYLLLKLITKQSVFIIRNVLNMFDNKYADFYFLNWLLKTKTERKKSRAECKALENGSKISKVEQWAKVECNGWFLTRNRCFWRVDGVNHWCCNIRGSGAQLCFSCVV